MTISIPDIVARGQQFRLVRADESLETFTGRSISIINRTAYWEFTIPLVPRSLEQSREWRVALAQLSDLTETFQASPPGYRGTAYAQAGGSPMTVDGATQLGDSLLIKGADPGVQIFKPGEFFEVNGELKVAVSNSFSFNAPLAGGGVVRFQPPLRQSPPDDAPLELLNPKATFRLDAPVASWQLSPNRIHSMTINAVETFE